MPYDPSNNQLVARHIWLSLHRGCRDEPYEIPVRRVPLKAIKPLISSGALHDASVIAALFPARRRMADNP